MDEGRGTSLILEYREATTPINGSCSTAFMLPAAAAAAAATMR